MKDSGMLQLIIQIVHSEISTTKVMVIFTYINQGTQIRYRCISNKNFITVLETYHIHLKQNVAGRKDKLRPCSPKIIMLTSFNFINQKKKKR